MELAKKGAYVILACRNVKKGESAALLIQKAINKVGSQGTVRVLELDTSKPESVSEFSKQFLALQKPLHFLVCNAGIAFAPNDQTPAGTCILFQTNYVGHFQLVNLLLPKLRDTASSGSDCRVVHVSSGSHFRATINFDDVSRPEQIPGNSRYGQSKLAQVK